MGARNVAYLIFLIPAVLSVIFASVVMADILQEPDRKLNMFQFSDIGHSIPTGDTIKIIGIQKDYSTSTPVKFQISITDSKFDCGDLYITIFENSISANNVFSQNGYFTQCYYQKNLLLPIDDEFAELIDSPGTYEILVEINDAKQSQTAIAKAKIMVK